LQYPAGKTDDSLGHITFFLFIYISFAISQKQL